MNPSPLRSELPKIDLTNQAIIDNWEKHALRAVIDTAEKITKFVFDTETGVFRSEEWYDDLCEMLYFQETRVHYNLVLLEHLLKHKDVFQNSQIVDPELVSDLRVHAIHSIAADALVMMRIIQKADMFAAIQGDIEGVTENNILEAINAFSEIVPSTPRLKELLERFNRELPQSQQEAIAPPNTIKRLSEHSMAEKNEVSEPPKKRPCSEGAKRASSLSKLEYTPLKKEDVLKAVKALCEKAADLYDPKKHKIWDVVSTANPKDKKQIRLQMYLRALIMELHLKTQDNPFKDSEIVALFDNTEAEDHPYSKSSLESFKSPANQSILEDFLNLIQFGTMFFPEDPKTIFQVLDLVEMFKFERRYIAGVIFSNWAQSLDFQELEQFLRSAPDPYRIRICDYILRTPDGEDEVPKEFAQKIVAIRNRTRATV